MKRPIAATQVAELVKKKKKDKKKPRKTHGHGKQQVSDLAASAGQEEDPTIGQHAQARARAFLERHMVTIHADDPPHPCTALGEAPFPAPLLEVLNMQPGFSEPSAVQGVSWPLAILGKDVLAIAKTGSGKTLAFLLPAITRCAQKIATKPAIPQTSTDALPSPLCLVMAPTRELALQTTQQANLFGECLGVRAVAVYGGVPKWAQAKDLNSGCEIIVATPGRMLDMLDLVSSSGLASGTPAGSRGCEGYRNRGEGSSKRDAKGGGKGSDKNGGKGGGKGASYSGYAATGGPCASLSLCEVLVLDEADRMLDMGFERDCRLLASRVSPSVRQTLMFTATWPAPVQRVADVLLRADHVRLTIGESGGKLSAAQSVAQRLRVVKPADKWPAFLELLATVRPAERVLVFCNTRREVNSVAAYCRETAGLACDTLSGDRTQGQREAVVRAFRDRTIAVVVATDVAARGLDIPAIDRVLNYDFPSGDSGLEGYVHRIGRTGRAGANGSADTLFTYKDSKHAKELVRLLHDGRQHVPDELEALIGAKRPRPNYGGLGELAKRQREEELIQHQTDQQLEQQTAKQQRADAFRKQCESWAAQ